MKTELEKYGKKKKRMDQSYFFLGLVNRYVCTHPPTRLYMYSSSTSIYIHVYSRE